MTENLMAALEIMGTGMFSLFTVMIIIAIAVVILNNIDKGGKDRNNQQNI